MAARQHLYTGGGWNISSSSDVISITIREKYSANATRKRGNVDENGEALFLLLLEELPR